jgi:hypothetical protein
VAPTAELTKFTFERARIALLQYMPHRVIEDDTRSSRLVITNLGGGTSEVRAKSTDNPTSLLGEALDWVVIDEASKIRDGVFESFIAPRLVDRKGTALIASTPRSVDSWLFQAWFRGQSNRDPEFESWRFPSTSNPLLDPAVIESERKRLAPAVFEQEYMARFQGEDALSCETCGGPSWEVCGVLQTLDARKEPRCPACRKFVDANGKTVVGRHPNGKPHLFIIDGVFGVAANKPRELMG